MSETSGARLLERKREGRMLAGVCAGMAAYFGLDANLIRAIFVVATFLGLLGPLVYVVAWAVVPEEGERESIVERLVSKNRA